MLESDRFFGRPYNENYSDRIETNNDRHIMAKHASIYPSEAELHAIQVLVTACEKSLKFCSDTIHEEQKPAKKVCVTHLPTNKERQARLYYNCSEECGKVEALHVCGHSPGFMCHVIHTDAYYFMLCFRWSLLLCTE